MGQNLLKNFIEATGLPPHLIQNEISKLLECSGINPDNLTVDDLREITATLLQNVFLELVD